MSYLNYFLYVKDQLIIFKISLIKVFKNYHLSSLKNTIGDGGSTAL